MIGFASGDLGAAQTAAAGALDALRAQTGRALDGLLHGTAEGDTLFELRGDVLRDELCVEVRGTDFDDVQSDGLAKLGFDLLAEHFDLRAALADDDAGAGAVDADLDLGVVALNFDLGNTGRIEGGLQILTDVVVLDDQIADLILTGIPTRVPIFNYADAQSMGINFLSHSNLLLKPSRSHRW